MATLPVGNAPIARGYTPGGHGGIDYMVPVGTDVHAVVAGSVAVAGFADPGGFGNLITVDSADGLQELYGHVSAIGVTVGQSVKEGQVIAKSGGEAGLAISGDSSGPHLHFEVDKGGKPVDPAILLGGATTSNATADNSWTDIAGAGLGVLSNPIGAATSLGADAVGQEIGKLPGALIGVLFGNHTADEIALRFLEFVGGAVLLAFGSALLVGVIARSAPAPVKQATRSTRQNVRSVTRTGRRTVRQVRTATGPQTATRPATKPTPARAEPAAEGRSALDLAMEDHRNRQAARMFRPAT